MCNLLCRACIHAGYTHAGTHCNTLQHTATHCNTLQHTCRQGIHAYPAVSTSLRACVCVCVCGAVCCIVVFLFLRRRYFFSRSEAFFLHPGWGVRSRQCNTRQRTTTHCTTLRHTATRVQRTAMHSNTRNMCCSILLYDAVCCSVKQRVAACSSRRCSQFKVGLFVTLRETLSERHFQRDTPRDKAIPNRAFLQHTATHCNTERMK